MIVRNKAAEICEKYLNKGDRVYIEGKIKTRKWQDDKGDDRYSTEIACTDFTFLTNKTEASLGSVNDQKDTFHIGENDSKEGKKTDLPF